MRKLFSTALVLLAVFMAGSSLAKTYVNGIDPNYPPFAYIDEKTGQAAGFDVDAMNWIAKNQGFVVQHQPMNWDGIIPALLANQIDMVCSGMSITPKRSAMVQFSAPYWAVNRVFVVPADSKLNIKEVLQKPISVGVQRGTSEAAALKEEKEAKGYPIELRFYESAPLAIEDLANGRIQAALMDELPADDAIAKGRKIKKIGTHGQPDGFGVALRKDEKKLRELIDEGYRALKADPYWKELQKKYLSK